MRILLSAWFVFLGAVIASAAYWVAPQGIGSIVGTKISTDSPAPSNIISNKRERGLKLLAEAAVERQLIDPYSAVFEDIRVVKKEKETENVCGIVNAKNRMGAYIGRTPFVYIALIDHVMLGDTSRDESSIYTQREISKYCSGSDR